MGFNNQTRHNFLFAILKPWEAYPGLGSGSTWRRRTIIRAWAIATGTVDFDIIEMGAPFEGDTAYKGFDEMLVG